MYIKMLCLVLILVFLPVLEGYAGLDLYFSDTTPPSPLMDDVVPVNGAFTINVMANAPVGTVAAVEFGVTWTPAANVDYTGASAGNFLPSAFILAADSDTPGAQTISVTTGSGANTIGSGTLVTLSFIKKTNEGPVTFDFGGVSALDLLLQPVTPAEGTPSSDITLPVVFSALSANVSQVGVTL